MEPSPLTRQTRPDSFQPKIVQLYSHLFNVRDPLLPSEGFWREFFLLPAEKDHFRQILGSLTADDVLHIQEQTRIFFARAIREIRGGIAPRNENALENMTAFFGGVLSKRYTHPSSDVITILASLDDVDKLMSDLVNGVDDLVRHGSNFQLRTKAIEAALALTAGAYQTSLISYLTNYDLFPALMKYVGDCDQASLTFEALLLLSLLANYNKFEFQNPYQNRLEDFVNQDMIQDLVLCVGHVCGVARDSYIAVHDDMPEGWNFNSALVYVGLRTSKSEGGRKKSPPSEGEAKILFDNLPPVEASVCLPAYSFVYANNLFASNLISSPGHKSKESPFAVFLSFTSYLSYHAFRSQRCLHYTLLGMLIVRSLVEDPILMKRLSSTELKTAVRLCRQRPPNPPLITFERIPISVMLDICADTISHNLRRRLDVPLYTLALGIILRITTSLGRNSVRFAHHWSYLWATLLSFLRFLTQYALDLIHLPNIRHDICSPLADLIAFCLSTGDTFLPDSLSYDDLFYKILETGSALLTKFRDAYYPQNSIPTSKSAQVSTNNSSSQPSPDPSSINMLISVSSHYQDLLQAEHGGKKVHQSPTAVQKLIRQGYETLSIQAAEDLGRWEMWREAGSWKAELKRIVRTVVADARRVGGEVNLGDKEGREGSGG